MPIDTDPSAFLCGDIQFYYLDLNIKHSTTSTYRTVPYLALRTLRIVKRFRARHFIPTTTITAIQNNSNNEYTKNEKMVFLSTHIEIAASPEKVRDVVCIFLFRKQIMILIQLNSRHTLSNHLAHLPLPLPLSSRLSSHPTHPLIHQF